MAAKDNLLKYIELQGIKKSDFYRSTGLSNGFLDKNANISSDKIEIIISNYPDLNLYWLITGQGEMLKSEDIQGSNIAHIAGGTNRFKQEINSTNNGSNIDYNLMQRIIEQQQAQILKYQEQVTKLLEKLL